MSETPEEDAWKKIGAWAMPKGLLFSWLDCITTRAEVSDTITCLCFPKPQMHEDFIRHAGANTSPKKAFLLCVICGEKRGGFIFLDL